MWRVCVIVLTAYNYGHPKLKAVRPAVLDQPLVSFHNNVDIAFSQSIQKIEIGKEKVIAFVSAGTERAQANLGEYFGNASNI
jgi:hypothetical protein